MHVGTPRVLTPLVGCRGCGGTAATKNAPPARQGRPPCFLFRRHAATGKVKLSAWLGNNLSEPKVFSFPGAFTVWHRDVFCDIPQHVEHGGARSLARVLGQCSSLALLNLAFNRIRGEGARSLAEALGQCSSLVGLNLEDNVIGLEGAKSLAQVLGRHCLL